jgi:hypothetical protein
MNIMQIIQQANSIADEDMSATQAIGFVNDAIARVNVKCKAEFPFFTINEANKEYEGFPETWQRALLIPFTVGRIKQTDSSQFEYSDAYGEFQDNLMTFQAHYVIPEQYKSTSVSSSHATDFTSNYWRWG